MNKEENLKQVILNALNEIACDDTGVCQVNFQSESARENIASQIEPRLEEYLKNRVSDAIEQVVCCRGDYCQ